MRVAAIMKGEVAVGRPHPTGGQGMNREPSHILAGHPA